MKLPKFLRSKSSAPSSPIDGPSGRLPSYQEVASARPSNLGLEDKSSGPSNFEGLDAKSGTGAPLPNYAQTIEHDYDGLIDTLREYDTVFLVDDSASMLTVDKGVKDKLSRWDQAKKAFQTIARVASEQDTDGVDIHFLNKESPSCNNQNITKGSEVEELFNEAKPEALSMECTPIGRRVDVIMRDYLVKFREGYRKKKLNLIVLTDGSSDDDVKEVIVHLVHEFEAAGMEGNQVGIQFIQIGNDPEAEAAFRHLDDDLKHEKVAFDIVDTMRCGATVGVEELTKALFGGVRRNIDARLLPNTSRNNDYLQGSSKGLKENVLKELAQFDTVFLVDDSTSMQWNLPATSHIIGPSRWDEARKAISKLAEKVAPYDKDGFDIHFLHDKNPSGENIKDPRNIEQLFKQAALVHGTPLGSRLKWILEDYMTDYQANRSKKPLNLIVVTDGMDDQANITKDTIVQVVCQLQELNAPLHQVGIQFLQIGSSVSATQYLRELDDNLSARISAALARQKSFWGVARQGRDIVDTHPYNSKQPDFEKILLGAINRKLDKMLASKPKKF